MPHKRMTTEFVKKLFLPIDSIILSILIIALGVVIVIWPELSTLIMVGLVGLGSLIVGGVRLSQYYKGGPLSEGARSVLTISLFYLVLGIVLLLMPYQLQSVVPFCMGMVLMVGAIIKLQVALEIRMMHFSGWRWVLGESLLCAALSIVSFFNPFPDQIWLIRFLGASLALEGIMDVIANIILKKAKKALISRMREAEEVILRPEEAAPAQGQPANTESKTEAKAE